MFTPINPKQEVSKLALLIPLLTVINDLLERET